MNYKIREYAAADLEGLLSSWENASRLAHPFLSEDFIEKERSNIPNIYLPIAETWVADSGDEVIGFIALIENEVGAIFVQPSFHGAGVGRALMDKAQERRGSLEVEVFKANSIGRRFYSNYGFELMSESVHEDTGQDLLRLKYNSEKQ